MSPLLLAVVASVAWQAPAMTPARTITVSVSFPASRSETPLDGRLILVLSQNADGEPRFHVTDGRGAQPVFGIDVEGWRPGAQAAFTDSVFGYPVDRLGELPASASGAGDPEPLRNIPARGRSRRQAAAGPRRGAAVGAQAGQPVQSGDGGDDRRGR